MLRIAPAIKRYAWGSTDALPCLMGEPATDEPVAELWYGAHPAGPSTAPGAITGSLLGVVQADPVSMLGEFEALPFLLKLLAPGSPVSLQVHPTEEDAVHGFRAEQSRGIAVDDPSRSFRDMSSKPEMLYAITLFDGLAGFRTRAEVRATVDRLPVAGRPLRDALARGDASDGMRAAMRHVLLGSPMDMDLLVHEAKANLESDPALATFLELVEYHPRDRGVVASLLLRRHRLNPGEALFVAPGTPHAYLGGVAVEVMANSDTVLRGGLTAKRVDSMEFLRCLNTARSAPEPLLSGVGKTSTFRPADAPFELTVARTDECATVVESTGPRIALVVAGRARIGTAEGEPIDLLTGGAVFVPACAGAITIRGDATTVVAAGRRPIARYPG
ncbi:MAG: mannose-6-phosphate isomerase, class I [Actinobacteria bacterium]|nr:mannose-6-phosphate isomerase, class I [Actinomycetota bacterium]